MTGPFKKVTEYQKERIKQLMQKDLDTSIIAGRLGLSYQQVRNAQVNMGLVKPKRRKT